MQKEKRLFEAIPNCRPKAKIDPGKLHCGESRRPARLDGIIAPPDRRPAAILPLSLPELVAIDWISQLSGRRIAEKT